jgi:hypothetical protein
VVEARLLCKILDELAYKYPHTKFVKGVATSVVENFRDNDVPGMLIYKNADLVKNWIPAKDVFGGKRMNTATVSYVLATEHAIELEVPDADPRDKLKMMNTVIKKGKDAGRRHEDSDHSEDEDDREYVNNQYQRYQQSRF